MENALILRAVKYSALPKPRGLGIVCGVAGTAQSPQRSKPRSPQGMFRRTGVSPQPPLVFQMI